MTHRYRPWGPLDWLLARLPTSPWSLLGVLGTEERCTATASVLAATGLRTARLLHVVDPWPSPAEDFKTLFDARRSRFRELGLGAGETATVQLLADIDDIRDQVEWFLADAGPDVLLDITSMPKWWFFPVTRMLMEDPRVRSLIATYTSALDYAKHLSSDPAPLAPLPTFNAPPDRSGNDELIVGIGFAPLSLRELYAASAGKIRYLFPFPPGPPNFFRNWEFLRVLETEIENRGMEDQDRYFVHMYDCPGVFAALASFTRNGAKTSALAPFGPKTLSLAMCVFALAAAEAGAPPVHVFYTQPRRYAPDYTTGIRLVDGAPDVKGYLLKAGGRPMYAL